MIPDFNRIRPHGALIYPRSVAAGEGAGARPVVENGCRKREDAGDPKREIEPLMNTLIEADRSELPSDNYEQLTAPKSCRAPTP
jgi:hypothetical protein